LALLPLLLERGPGRTLEQDRDVVQSLRDLGARAPDPKAALLERLLSGRAGKTLVFVQPRATVRYLLRRLRGLRVAAVVGDTGLFGSEPATRAEVLAAFAPRAQRAPPPVPALETDVLIATDLLSEGLNLQDATRVVHYDLPWTPARLAQRVGRVDRLGSPHARVETVTFLPPEELERAPAGDAPRLLERAARGEAVAVERARLARAIQRAAPFVRTRLAALADVRWRATDRDRLSRRLIPWVLEAARRAARRGAAAELTRLDALVSRLGLGMTAGEELSLEQILARRTPLTVRAVLAWHEGLAPSHHDGDQPGAALVAAVLFEPG